MHGDESYNIFTNNCAKNVAEILKKLPARLKYVEKRASDLFFGRDE